MVLIIGYDVSHIINYFALLTAWTRLKQPYDKVPLREPHATHWTGREYVLKQKQSRTLVKNIHQLLMSHLTPNVEHLQTVSQGSLDCNFRIV